MPDIERLSDEGIKEHFESWHTLGALDEDEILHRIELHIDELPEEMHKEQNRIRLEKRLEKQNPEAMRKWREWKKRE